MTRRISLGGGTLSPRVGAALAYVTELARIQTSHTKYGFHPQVGFTAKPRETSPGEARLFDASLRFLLRGVRTDFPDVVTDPAELADLTMWVCTSSLYIDFCLAITQEYENGSGDGPSFEPDIPPNQEARVLTDPEMELYEAAQALLIRSYDVEVDPGLLAEAGGRYDDDSFDDDYGPAGPMDPDDDY